MATRARYFRGRGCCEGRAPVWDYIYEGGIGGIGGPLSDDERDAIYAVENYGGTFHAGYPPKLMPMEHTNLVDWNRPIFMSAGDSWSAPYNRNLPRLNSFADLPSLPNPDVGPQNGLPHHQQTLDFQKRERVKRVSFANFRIIYNETTGQHRVQILWCRGCGPDPWEQFCDDLGETFTEMVPVIRGIAMVCSYVPVFGTAIAFVIDTATSLAEGRDFDDAFLDGVGGALPGQPASGVAFTAARSVINGDRLDKTGLETALALLPADEKLRTAVGAAVEIAWAVARGNNIADATLDEFRQQLPEAGRKTMDIARRACAGENVGGILSAEAMDVARNAAAQGAAAMNSYVAQAGFQAAMDLAPGQLRDAIRAGVAVGAVELKTRQFIGTFGSVPEKNVARNETYLQKGQRIIAAGAKYGSRLVSDILRGNSFSIVIERYDALNSRWEKRAMKYKVNGPFSANERPLTDAWRRGFTIAIGACEGKSERGPHQTLVYQAMAEAGGRDGFEAGQAVAWWITKRAFGSIALSPTQKKSSGAAQMLLDQLAPAKPPVVTKRRKGVRIPATPGALEIPRDQPGAAARPMMTRLHDALAAQGNAVVLADPLLASMRGLEPEGPARVGFDVGIAIAADDTLWGPGKQATIDKLPAAEKASAERAAHFKVERNAKAEFALVGAKIAQKERRRFLVKGRAAQPPGNFTLGFDVATALFASGASGGFGHTEQGPGSNAIRASLPTDAIRGFDAAARLHLGP